MKDLIAKLEAATEANQRDLVLECLDGAYAIGQIDQNIYSRALDYWEVGAYLDAALTLVPEGWQWDVRWAEFPQPKPTAFVWPPGQRAGNAEAAATPALALCIAALKARETI